MADSELDLLRGTLDVLILKTLTWQPMHGFGIARWIRDLTQGTLQIDDGALYPALHRLEHRGWVSSDWGISDNNRRAKFYTLTSAGRAQLRAQTASWDRYADAVTTVLRASAQPG